MNKKARLLIAGLTIAMAGSFGLVGCTSKAKEESTKTAVESDKSTFKEYSYTYNDGNNKPVEVKVTKAPQRAVTLSQFMTESLLALGLEDRMVGTALLDNEILPEYKEAYEKIPQLQVTDGHDISKEGFLALKPDFASGWLPSLDAKSVGAPDELYNNYQVNPYVLSSLKGDATIENVYKDFEELGKIFDVEDKATEVINKMKSEVKAVEEKIKVSDKKPSVLVYDSGEKDAFVVGSGFANNLITLAGGNNIFSNLKDQWATVSFESIIAKNPDVILVTTFLADSTNVDKKIEFLKTNPAFKNINAIKNNNIHVIELADLSPGIRTAKAITEMNEVFYKDAK